MLFIDSAMLPFRENGGFDSPFEETELERAISGSGKAYAIPAVGASAL
jgi:hypothetical protein